VGHAARGVEQQRTCMRLRAWANVAKREVCRKYQGMRSGKAGSGSQCKVTAVLGVHAEGAGGDRGHYLSAALNRNPR
jgi:hypothetical protein